MQSDFEKQNQMWTSLTLCYILGLFYFFNYHLIASPTPRYDYHYNCIDTDTVALNFGKTWSVGLAPQINPTLIIYHDVSCYFVVFPSTCCNRYEQRWLSAQESAGFWLLSSWRSPGPSQNRDA